MSLLTLSFMLVSCSSTRKMAKKAPAGETLVHVYCSGPQYESNSKAFKAHSVGESMDQAISQKIAMNNVRTALASKINDVVQSTVDNYFKQLVNNKNAELEKDFQSLSREVVDQELVDTKTVCEEVTKTTSGNYKTYVAIEMANERILSSLNHRISQDTKLKIDYDYTKFKKEFNQVIQNEEKNR